MEPEFLACTSSSDIAPRIVLQVADVILGKGSIHWAFTPQSPKYIFIWVCKSGCWDVVAINSELHVSLNKQKVHFGIKVSELPFFLLKFQTLCKQLEPLFAKIVVSCPTP